MSVLSAEPRGLGRSPEDLGFEDLISPLEPERFFAENWERRYLFLARGEAGFYDRLLSLEDVDHLLRVARSSPDSALTLGPPRGSDKSRIRAPACEVSTEQVYRAFCEGFSMRLAGVHRFWPPLDALRATLAERLSASISIELYLTPASTQGVTAHYDNRDAFILQLHGSKRWHLGEPDFELPGLGLNHVTDRVPGPMIDNDSPRLAESVVMGPGDLLYLPRGFYHQPVAEEETSLHLSVVVYPLAWTELLGRALELVALDHLPLRRALPPGFALDPKARRAMAETFAELVEVFAREAPFDDALDNVIRDVRSAQEPPADGHFAALDRSSSVSAGSVLERRRGITCVTETGNGSATLRFGPNFVTGPPALEPAFAFLCSRRRFRVGELPGSLSDRSKLVLARRLIREGLLRFPG